MQNDPLISIRDLHVSFGSVEVLHGIDLDIEQGVIHALIGESGSGKSVLARSILGLAGNNCRINGSIRFQGNELLTLSAEEYRKLRGAEIAMVVQDAMSALNPMRTIGHQLMETTSPVAIRITVTTIRQPYWPPISTTCMTLPWNF